MRRIIKGYRRRDLLKLQMMAECVYGSIYAMRDPKGMTPQKMFPELFKVEDYNATAPDITEEEERAFKEEMAYWNSGNFKWQ